MPKPKVIDKQMLDSSIGEMRRATKQLTQEEFDERFAKLVKFAEALFDDVVVHYGIVAVCPVGDPIQVSDNQQLAQMFARGFLDCNDSLSDTLVEVMHDSALRKRGLNVEKGNHTEH